MNSTMIVDADTMGTFTLKLHHRNVISGRNNWLIAKDVLHEEFRQYMSEKQHEGRNTSSMQVELLLTATGYARSVDSTKYRICTNILFQFRNRLIKKLDNQRKCQQMLVPCREPGPRPNSANSDQPINIFEIDGSDAWEPLTFQGGDLHMRKSTFHVTNIACFVCQINFTSLDIFKQHIACHHPVDNKFSLLRESRDTLCSWTSPRVTLSYKQCKNSHFVCFAIVPLTQHIIIENVIMVYPSAMKDLRDAWDPVPSPPGFNNYFYIDARLLPVGKELSIIVVFHNRFNDYFRMVEQHLFMRMNEFPLPMSLVCTNLLPNTRIFEPNHGMSLYEPCQNVVHAVSCDEPIAQLCRLSPQFADYINRGRTLSYYNMFRTLSILLQVEDVTTMCSYFNLTQFVPRLPRVNGKYTVYFNAPPRLHFENVIFPYDDVLIIAGRRKYIIDHLMPLNLMLMDKNTLNSFNERGRVIYFGRVVRSNMECVTFVCQHRIPDNEPFMLVFRSNRRSLRQQCSAIEMLLKAPSSVVMRYLYPKAAAHYGPIPNIQYALFYPITDDRFFINFTYVLARLDLFNPKIADDDNQHNAVRVIAHREAHFDEVPFVVFGPAGSGKTTVVVEAILQLYLRQSETKILVTAGANSACNEIALRLLTALAKYNDRRACVRIFARSNEKRNEYIHPLIIEHSNIYGHHFYPAIDVLHEYRIVVCTLSVVASLRSENYGSNGQLTHIFVDEAAASTQMETLAAIAGLMSPTTSLIVSGDHKQLNQMLHSRFAVTLGLDISLMERLLFNECYHVDNVGNYDRSVQTRLRNNYRSHPAIVKLFSRMFYNGELVPLASDDVQFICKNWHRSYNPTHPIYFHSVIGHEEYYVHSPSAHNMRELNVIMGYVKELLYFGINGKAVEESDIGIISPYKEQCALVNKELAQRKWFGVESGTVEVFQGREKHILIVSFVRTNSMGFLHNSRRLNVIISRARSLLILIGNPNLLVSNSQFKYIIDECRRNNTLIGYRFDNPIDELPALEHATQSDHYMGNRTANDCY